MPAWTKISMDQKTDQGHLVPRPRLGCTVALHYWCCCCLNSVGGFGRRKVCSRLTNSKKIWLLSLGSKTDNCHCVITMFSSRNHLFGDCAIIWSTMSSHRAIFRANKWIHGCIPQHCISLMWELSVLILQGVWPHGEDPGKRKAVHFFQMGCCDPAFPCHWVLTEMLSGKGAWQFWKHAQWHWLFELLDYSKKNSTIQIKKLFLHNQWT